jgi:hypothetical protein
MMIKDNLKKVLMPTHAVKQYAGTTIHQCEGIEVRIGMKGEGDGGNQVDHVGKGRRCYDQRAAA